MCIITYRRKLYILQLTNEIIWKSTCFGVVGETHAHDSFELIWCDNGIDISPSPIRTSCTCDVKMFNLHLKQTEISRKRKTAKDVILSF